MKKLAIILAVLLACGAASAQTRDDFSAELGARMSVEIDKRILKGWHVYASEQIRLDDNLTTFDRFHTTVGTSYKPLDWLKFGVEYSFINHYKPNAKEWENRHRGSFFLTESIKYGLWTFSFTETFRATYKAYEINEAQGPKTQLQAKLRFRAKYRGWGYWRPYFGIEGRMTLNGTYGTFSDDFKYYTFDSYSDLYLNRVRGTVGVEWKVGTYSAIDFKILTDYNFGVDLDLKSDGTTVKSLTQENKLMPSLCVGYTFSF